MTNIYTRNIFIIVEYHGTEFEAHTCIAFAASLVPRPRTNIEQVPLVVCCWLFVVCCCAENSKCLRVCSSKSVDDKVRGGERGEASEKVEFCLHKFVFGSTMPCTLGDVNLNS